MQFESINIGKQRGGVSLGSRNIEHEEFPARRARERRDELFYVRRSILSYDGSIKPQAARNGCRRLEFVPHSLVEEDDRAEARGDWRHRTDGDSAPVGNGCHRLTGALSASQRRNLPA